MLTEQMEVYTEKFVFVRSRVLVTTDNVMFLKLYIAYIYVAFLDTNQLRLKQAITAIISSITLTHFFTNLFIIFFHSNHNLSKNKYSQKKSYSIENIYIIPKHVR